MSKSNQFKQNTRRVYKVAKKVLTWAIVVYLGIYTGLYLRDQRICQEVNSPKPLITYDFQQFCVRTVYGTDYVATLQDVINYLNQRGEQYYTVPGWSG